MCALAANKLAVCESQASRLRSLDARGIPLLSIERRGGDPAFARFNAIASPIEPRPMKPIGRAKAVIAERG
jgi:hypothetical protein